jgi:ABC-type transport system involved in multi-copper enzyme maturation permease subunit
VSPFAEIRLIVERELKKNLRSIKGLILFSVSLLGALATTVKLPKFELKALSNPDVSPGILHEAKAVLWTQLYFDCPGDTQFTEACQPSALGNYLANAPLKLGIIFFLAVWLAPLLVTLMGFDSVSGEIQHRSVRFWTVRTRRSSFFVGKFLGLWSVVSIVTLLMHVLVWIVTLARGEAGFVETLSWGLRFWLFSLPVSAVWCGLATFISAMFRMPILALLVICALFFTLFLVGRLIGRGAEVEWLTYLYPNTFDAWIASPLAHRALVGVLVCLGFAGVPTAAGALIFARRDI